jgi:3-deoxy-manno-octulosonate cytidylyltransferase (CMP-KDO synthetase)
VTKPKPNVTVVSPARYGSSRFPGKPLALLGRKPMIQHVYEQAAACRAVADVLVATDDERIQQAVERFGGKAILMTGDFRTGTDRVAGIARTRTGRFFVDLQGDEIPLDPELLADLIEPFVESGAEMGTLKRALTSDEELHHLSVVKVVTDQDGRALYFSRAPIPLVRDDPRGRATEGLHYIHVGVYIYTRETLLKLAALPTGVLEEAEKLEQLRALEHGISISVWETKHESLRVDTPADAEKVSATLQQLELSRQAQASIQS